MVRKGFNHPCWCALCRKEKQTIVHFSFQVPNMSEGMHDGCKGCSYGPTCVLGYLKAEWFYSGAGQHVCFALMKNNVCHYVAGGCISCPVGCLRMKSLIKGNVVSPAL